MCIENVNGQKNVGTHLDPEELCPKKLPLSCASEENPDAVVDILALERLPLALELVNHHFGFLGLLFQQALGKVLGQVSRNFGQLGRCQVAIMDLEKGNTFKLAEIICKG